MFKSCFGFKEYSEIRDLPFIVLTLTSTKNSTVPKQASINIRKQGNGCITFSGRQALLTSYPLGFPVIHIQDGPRPYKACEQAAGHFPQSWWGLSEFDGFQTNIIAKGGELDMPQLVVVCLCVVKWWHQLWTQLLARLAVSRPANLAFWKRSWFRLFCCDSVDHLSVSLGGTFFPEGRELSRDDHSFSNLSIPQNLTNLLRPVYENGDSSYTLTRNSRIFRISGRRLSRKLSGLRVRTRVSANSPYLCGYIVQMFWIWRLLISLAWQRSVIEFDELTL